MAPTLQAEVTALTISVATVNGKCYPIVPRGSALPVSVRWAACMANDTNPYVYVALYEGESAMCCNNRMLARMAVKREEKTRTITLAVDIESDGELKIHTIEDGRTIATMEGMAKKRGGQVYVEKKIAQALEMESDENEQEAIKQTKLYAAIYTYATRLAEKLEELECSDETTHTEIKTIMEFLRRPHSTQELEDNMKKDS